MNAIQIRGLGKKYTILHEGKGSSDYTTLRDVISGSMGNFWRRAAGKNDETAKSKKEEIWALKDINLEIAQGGKIGIIGRNGAGKTTLLKILSRITEPTRGHAELNGRVSSLLEVGTGFHPELTGSENIYLNGAVLGLKKAEIDKKFDEIVDFSGVEKFLDTPVKRYSSGMKVRLAFAVAAHLEPEILLVDEVLAVGDAEFQKKCLGKMDDVSSREGRTILFVSHNMAAIQALCERAVLLEDGRVKADGEVEEVVDVYLQRGMNELTSIWENTGNEFENLYFKPAKVMICDKDGNPLKGPVRSDEQVYFRIEGVVNEVDNNTLVSFNLYDSEDRVIFTSFCPQDNVAGEPKFVEGYNIFRAAFPRKTMNEGRYTVKPFVQNRPAGTGHGKLNIIHPSWNTVVLSFEISGGLSDSPAWIKRRAGVMAPSLLWQRL